MSDRDPAHLEPTTRERFHAGVALYRQRHSSRGLRVLVVTTWRSAVEQEEARAHGLSKKKYGKSLHNVTGPDGRPRSYAVDYMLMDNCQRLLKGTSKAEAAEYRLAGECFEAVGFVWIGRRVKWDLGHVQAPVTLEEAKAGVTPSWPELPAIA